MGRGIERGVRMRGKDACGSQRSLEELAHSLLTPCGPRASNVCWQAGGKHLYALSLLLALGTASPLNTSQWGLNCTLSFGGDIPMTTHTHSRNELGSLAT